MGASVCGPIAEFTELGPGRGRAESERGHCLCPIRSCDLHSHKRRVSRGFASPFPISMQTSHEIPFDLNELAAAFIDHRIHNSRVSQRRILHVFVALRASSTTSWAFLHTRRRSWMKSHLARRRKPRQVNQVSSRRRRRGNQAILILSCTSG